MLLLGRCENPAKTPCAPTQIQQMLIAKGMLREQA
jgi:hypothetical protein